jgi:hypothetical protein
MVQYDCNVVYFTTKDFPNVSIRRYLRVLNRLIKKILKGRPVLFVEVASWYKPAHRLLRLEKFRPYHKTDKYWVYVRDGK